MLAIILALAAAISWGANPLFARRAMQKVDVISTNFYGILAGLVFITAYSYVSGELEALPAVGAEQVTAFALAGIAAIVLARTFYYLSIKKVGPGPSIAVVSASVLVAPVVALFAFNEVVSFKMAAGFLMIFAGIYCIAIRQT